MPIPESDISIIIPTYKYRDKMLRAVKSALASGAGEILVVDDCGEDGTIEALAQFSDRRLVIRENARNLGLWENHLMALQLATRPWIKFIQADDYLLPSGLASFAAAADDGVAVVWGAPWMINDITGVRRLHYSLLEKRRMSPQQLQHACLYFGWMLGSPSYMMLRSDAVARDPAVWQTMMSADMVVGSIAATCGDVVLIPPGAIGHGWHPLQDSYTQSSRKSVERMVNSLAYLRSRPEAGLRNLANSWTYLNLGPVLHTSARGIVRREGNPAAFIRLPLQMLAHLSRSDWRDIAGSHTELRRAATFRRKEKTPFDLDKLLPSLRIVS